MPITVSSSPIVPQLTKFLKCARKFRFMLTNHLTKKKKRNWKTKTDSNKKQYNWTLTYKKAKADPNKTAKLHNKDVVTVMHRITLVILFDLPHSAG